MEDLGNLSYVGGKKCLVISKKIIILGEGGIGKTSLLMRYTTGKFAEDTKMTIGSDFFVKNIKFTHGFCDVYLKLLLWDFAGEPRFRFLLKDYTKGSDIVLVAFDLSRMKSLYHLIDWMEVLEGLQTHAKDIPIYLIGNKQDLINNSWASVDYDYIKKWIQDYNITKYFETSSRTGFNVENLFQDVTQKLIDISRKNDSLLLV